MVTGHQLRLLAPGSPHSGRLHDGAGVGSGVPPLALVGHAHFPVVESHSCRQLVDDHFDELCGQTLQQRLSRSAHVQATLMALLPRLAAFKRSRLG